MRRFHPARAAGLAAAVLLVVTICPVERVLLAKAQSPAPQASAEARKPEWSSINVVHVRPEMLNEWQDLQKTEVIPALKKAGVKEREAWATGVFGEAYEYVFVTNIEHFAQYDSPSPLVKALGEEGAKSLGEKIRRMTASSHTYAVRFVPDLSYETKMTEAPKLAIVTNVQIAPGRGADFASFIKTEWLPAVKKAQVAGYWVMQTAFGGDTNSYVTVVPLQSFAELDNGHPVERALGEAGMKRLAQTTSSFVTRVERSISRYVPELSFHQTTPSSD